jgi:hypothetical protein
MYEKEKSSYQGECAMPPVQSEIHDQLSQLTMVIEELDNVIGRLTVRMQPVTNDALVPKDSNGCAAVPRAALSPLGETLRERQGYLRDQVARLESLLQRLAV